MRWWEKAVAFPSLQRQTSWHVILMGICALSSAHPPPRPAFVEQGTNPILIKQCQESICELSCFRHSAWIGLCALDRALMEGTNTAATTSRQRGRLAKRSEAEYVAEQRTRLEKSLHRRAKEMGYELTKIETPDRSRAATGLSDKPRCPGSIFGNSTPRDCLTNPSGRFAYTVRTEGRFMSLMTPVQPLRLA